MLTMRKYRWTIPALLALCWLVPTPGQDSASDEDSISATEIRIALPSASDPRVAVTPGERRVTIELPRGSVFPLDFSVQSGGLVRGGEVTPIGDDRLQLDLELAQGLLDRVEFQPDALVLRFTTRYHTSSDPTAGDSYILGPDDKILLAVNNQPELTSHLVVNRDGTITAPLIGDIRAAGLSPRQLAVRVAEQLGRDYLVDPQVDIVVEDFRSQWVMISGEVRLPGRFPLRGGTRLKESLSEAGGLTDNAGESVTISRQSAGTGEYEVIRVDRTAFEAGEANPVLLGGDIVDVGRAEYCYLQGEVRVPGRVRIERGMSLLRAISLSGGLTEWADRKSVTVLYPAGHEPSEQEFSIKRIHAGKDEDPVLKGREIIVVGRRLF